MQKVEVTKKHDGSRLDIFLKESLNVSRKQAKQWIDQGMVFLQNKKIIIASWEVKMGQTITIHETPPINALPRKERFLKIYFEDKDIIVVEKPAGVPCEHTAQTTTSSIVDDVNDYLRRTQNVEKVYLGLMHRLDQGTSGLMVFSKSRAGNKLSDQFKRHTIGRKYYALVEGSLKKEQGQLKSYLGPDSAHPNRQKSFTKSSPTHKLAITDYRVLERYTNVSLVEATLKTGRTHQVRVQFATIGHPILGDKLYGHPSKLKRQALHACFLQFKHPVNNKLMKVESPLPKDLQLILDNLRR